MKNTSFEILGKMIFKNSVHEIISLCLSVRPLPKVPVPQLQWRRAVAANKEDRKARRKSEEAKEERGEVTREGGDEVARDVNVEAARDGTVVRRRSANM